MTNLTEETFENLLKMLCSEDLENQTIGLRCIDQLDLERNLLYIILLRKLGWASTTQWREEAPLAESRLRQITHPENIMVWPYENILTLIKGVEEIDPGSIRFLMKHLATLMEKKLYGFRPDLIEELKIIIKFKDDN